jgi:hypothetical protein
VLDNSDTYFQSTCLQILANNHVLFEKKCIPTLSKLSLLTRKLKGKHLLYTFCINHMNVDTERGGRVALSFISSHKYVIPEIKSFSCIGKYLIFNKTYCSTYPTRKCVDRFE